MARKPNMIIDSTCITAVNKLSDNQAGKLFKSLLSYHCNGNVSFDDLTVELLFDMMKPFIDKNIEKYNDRCKANRENGLKGGRPKTQTEKQETQNNPAGSSENPNNPNGSSENPNNLNQTKPNQTKPNQTKPKEKEYNNTTINESFSFILKNGKDWILTQAKYDEYKGTYPLVDVDVEFKKMIQWLIDNPGRRKTAAGMGRFINSWLARAKPDEAKLQQKKLDEYSEKLLENAPTSEEARELLRSVGL